VTLAAAGGVEDRAKAIGDALWPDEFFERSIEVALVVWNERELGESVSAAWLAQNSSANPLDVSVNPVGAFVMLP
jgi:hypothetical protein